MLYKYLNPREDDGYTKKQFSYKKTHDDMSSASAVAPAKDMFNQRVDDVEACADTECLKDCMQERTFYLSTSFDL